MCLQAEPAVTGAGHGSDDRPARLRLACARLAYGLASVANVISWWA
jgi:hypothetical protein